MDSSHYGHTSYFGELFIVASAVNKVDEKEKIYQTYIERCFIYLLEHSDEYIVSTIKNNDSLTSFFLSYFSNNKKYYDLNFLVSKWSKDKIAGEERKEEEREYLNGMSEYRINGTIEDEEKEKEKEESNNETVQYGAVDKLVLKFYERVIHICLRNGDKTSLTEIQSFFFKIPIVMDVIMTFAEMEKTRIQLLLKHMYAYDSFRILHIDIYIKFLYKELTNIEVAINGYKNEEDVLDIYDEDVILFQLNEFLFCVYSFVKFFKKYYFFNTNKERLTDLLITIKLFSYLTDNHTNGISVDTLHYFKDEKSFLNIFIQVYAEVINTLYLKENEEERSKKILYLRFRFVKILNMYIKQVLLYTDKKKSKIYVTHVIEALKETKEKIDIQFLRNDVQLHNWDFIDEMVLKGVLDFEFYSDINDFLQMRSEQQEQCLMKQKYETEIAQIKEVTNLTNEPFLLALLKKGNFDVSNCVNMIFAMSEDEMEAFEEEVEERHQKEEENELNVEGGNDEFEGEEAASEKEEATDEESSDEESSDEESSDEESSDGESSDEEISDGESDDEEISDGESDDEEISDGESDDEEISVAESSDEKSNEEGSSEEESSEEESSEEESSEEETESDEQNGEIIQLDEIDIISGNVDYIPDVVSILKEKKRKKKTKKKNKDQKDGEDAMKEAEKQKIKERIMQLLNRSDSSEAASNYLEDDIENDMIFPVPFSEDLVEEMETIPDEYAIPGLRRTNEEERDGYEVENNEQIETGEKEQQQQQQQDSSKEKKNNVTYTKKGNFHEKKHDFQLNYNPRKYNEHNGKRKNEMQNNYKKIVDNHQGRSRHISGKTHFNKPDNNKSYYNRSYFNKPNYNKPNYKKPSFNKKWEKADEQTVEQKGSDVSTESHNTSSIFRNNKKLHTCKKNDAPNETDKNLDKEKEKRQYARKRMTAGKNYRKQYDKKMSRGMF